MNNEQPLPQGSPERETNFSKPVENYRILTTVSMSPVVKPIESIHFNFEGMMSMNVTLFPQICRKDIQET